MHNDITNALVKFQKKFWTPKISSYETLNLLPVQLKSHCPIYTLRDIAKIFTLVDDSSWIWVEYQSFSKHPKLHAYKISTSLDVNSRSYGLNTETLFRKLEV